MTQPAKAQEPSMEEILASIRRIIADDDVPKGESVPAEPPALSARPAAAVPERPVRQVELDVVLSQMSIPAADRAAADEPAADVLELTEAMAAATGTERFRTVDSHSDLVFAGAAEAPQQAEPGPATVPLRNDSGRRLPTDAERALVSSVTSAAVDSAFNTLAHTVLVQNARTLEDLVREMLRPMLKTWLDDNLPGLVERLVRAEIERVSRGRT
jgi:cell pole-organizing protein PopZ